MIEEWLVLDATDGTVLGRADTQTVAAGSGHVSHPDPGQMGLSVGEGRTGRRCCGAAGTVSGSPSNGSTTTGVCSP